MYKPVIGVVMCRNRLKGHQTQTLQEKYLNAIVNAGGVPIALPHALAEPAILLPPVALDGIYLPAQATYSRTYMVKTAMSPCRSRRDLLSMAPIHAASKAHPHFRHLPWTTGTGLSPRLAGLCIVVCSSSLSFLNTAKTPNFPSSSNMRPRMKFRFRKEDYFLS
ncbi:gamma-glutamyl-gamma-aminobutyrate hydrolase family protein [Escherichia coli]